MGITDRITDRISLVLGRDLTLGTLMERVAGAHGSKRLVDEAGGETLTFTEAAARVDQWAGGIAAATEPGERVVIATPNGYEQFLLTLAAARAGRVPAPVNDQMSASEVDHVVADSGASLVIRSASDLPADAGPFGNAVATDASSIAALFYTSGTTGKPKGAQLTHKGLLGGMPLTAALPTELRKDELLVALPVAHIYGFAIVLGAACAGVPVHFLPRFNPVKVLDAIEERGISMFAGVPAMYRMLLEAGAEERNLKSVRVWISGADAMPAELSAKFKRMGATFSLPVIGGVGEAIFAEGYGMVETGGESP